MRAEIVAQALQQVGRPAGAPQAVDNRRARRRRPAPRCRARPRARRSCAMRLGLEHRVAEIIGEAAGSARSRCRHRLRAMRSRKRARMMQPPRQIVETSPSFRSQPNSVGGRRHLLEALRIGDDLGGVERVADGVDIGLAAACCGRGRVRRTASRPRRAACGGREGAGEDRLGDRGQRHAEIERRLGRPAAGALLLGLVDDGVDQRACRSASRLRSTAAVISIR